MQKLLLCLGFIALLATPLLAKESTSGATDPAPSAATAEARDAKAMARVFKEPIKMTLSEDSAMHVTFKHKRHKGPACEQCHHKASPAGERITSCNAPGCHVLSGKSTDPMSLFQAFHSKENDRSCYGCHLQERAHFKGIKGCTTCHKQRAEK